MPLIYRKTPKGMAEIVNRSVRLGTRSRSILILVNGKRDADDLSTLMARPAEDSLLALAEAGYIEAVGETVGLAEVAATSVG